MKRYLTLILVFITLISIVLSGCTGARSTPEVLSPSQLGENGQPPQAEASRENVSGLGKSVVFGFYTDSGTKAKDSVLKHLKALDEVAFFWYSFDGIGKVKRAGNVDLTLKEAVHNGGAKAYALVHNMGSKEFDSQLAHQVLANNTIRANLINNLVTLTTKEKWDGITIDIEKIPANDRNNYSSFINELHSALKSKSKILNVSIPAKYQDLPNDLWSGAFDYAAIGKSADQVILMTYEEHGVTTTQGPIASQGWVNRVINFAMDKIPKGKIVMGLPVYASNWASNKPTVPTYFTYAKAVELAKKNNVSILYDETQQSPHYSFTNAGVRHEIYLENVRSLTAKLTIAKKNQLHGVAIWKLGIEDPTLWTEVLKDYGSVHK